MVPRTAAAGCVSPARGVSGIDEALEGAKHILAERFAEDADLVGRLREDFWRSGTAVSKVRKGDEPLCPSPSR